MKSIVVQFSFTSDTGAVSTTSFLNTIIEQQILDILITNPGERVMNARYGAGLNSLLFEEMDPLVFAEYRVDAMQELNEFLTVGKVVDMNITMPDNNFSFDETESTITVSVRYSVPPFGSSVVTFNLSNSETTTLGGAR